MYNNRARAQRYAKRANKHYKIYIIIGITEVQGGGKLTKSNRNTFRMRKI